MQENTVIKSEIYILQKHIKLKHPSTVYLNSIMPKLKCMPFLIFRWLEIYVDLIRNINSEVVNNIQTHSIP